MICGGICGGNDLYWLSVDQLEHQNSTFGQTMAQDIAMLRAAPPYPKSGMASLLPVVINVKHRFAWVTPNLAFQPARAQYLSF